jgi:2-haloalkanoic acid dehalogenase type II
LSQAHGGLIVFDVNATSSDMAPIAGRFEDVGAPAHLASSWFAGLLRDGFALTVARENPAFGSLGADGLRTALAGLALNRTTGEAVDHIMAGFAELAVHPDVADGIRALAELGIRLVTLSNGSASIAERLLGDAGLADRFESFLSVEQAGSGNRRPAPTRWSSTVLDPIAGFAMRRSLQSRTRDAPPPHVNRAKNMCDQPPQVGNERAALEPRGLGSHQEASQTGTPPKYCNDPGQRGFRSAPSGQLHARTRPAVGQARSLQAGLRVRVPLAPPP